MADFTGYNPNNPLRDFLRNALTFVEDYGWYVIAVGLVATVAANRFLAWQAAREREESKAAAMDPARRAQLDAQRQRALANRFKADELAEASRKLEEEKVERARREKIERYDNLQQGKSNKKSGLSGWKGGGGGGGGDDGGHRPSWARRRPNPCGPKGG